MRSLPAGARAVLLDVEGTVGDVRFVTEVLFPYARARLGAFVTEHAAAPEVAPLLAEAATRAGVPADDTRAILDALEAWSDTNAKVGPLKALQGMIWQAGYRAGALRAHVYDDVPVALRAWATRGLAVAIYSSGSVLAQKLYFTHSAAGDLTPFLRAYFDTAVGAKGDRASYERIAATLGFPAGAVSFFSDAIGEVLAARSAGMHAVRVDRTLAPESSGVDPEGTAWWGGIGEE